MPPGKERRRRQRVVCLARAGASSWKGRCVLAVCGLTRRAHRLHRHLRVQRPEGVSRSGRAGELVVRVDQRDHPRERRAAEELVVGLDHRVRKLLDVLELATARVEVELGFYTDANAPSRGCSLCSAGRAGTLGWGRSPAAALGGRLLGAHRGRWFSDGRKLGKSMLTCVCNDADGLGGAGTEDARKQDLLLLVYEMLMIADVH